MNYASRVVATLLLALTTASLSLATPIPPRLPPVGAYSAGIGLTSIAAFDDPSFIYWNPAGLAMANMMAAQLNLVSFRDARPTSWSALAVNAAPNGEGRFALGLIRRKTSNASGDFTSFEVNAPLAYVDKDRRYPFGFSLKWQAENYGDEWVNAFRMDFGVAIVARGGSSKLSFSALNLVGGRLRAFPREYWAGLAVGSDTAAFRFTFQCRFEQPFNGKYISKNYSVGGRWRQLEGPFESRAGIIRDNSLLRYCIGFGYHQRIKQSHFETALIFDPDNGSDRTYFLTYGYTVGPGSPSSNVGRPSRF